MFLDISIIKHSLQQEARLVGFWIKEGLNETIEGLPCLVDRIEHLRVVGLHGNNVILLIFNHRTFLMECAE